MRFVGTAMGGPRAGEEIASDSDVLVLRSLPPFSWHRDGEVEITLVVSRYEWNRDTRQWEWRP